MQGGVPKYMAFRRLLDEMRHWSAAWGEALKMSNVMYMFVTIS